MIIERVELQNVLSHRRSVVHFQPGVTVIVGPNGAGKTSIIDAISYALFERHSRGKGREREAIVRLDAAQAQVTLDFRVNGTLYRVRKVIPKRGVSRALLYQVADGSPRLLAEGVTSVRRELERLLGISPELASILYITRQGELEAILSNKAAREKLINTIFGFDKMDKAYTRMLPLIKEFEKELVRLQERLRERESRAETLRGRVREKERIERRIVELEEEARRLRGEIERLSPVAARAEAYRSELAEVRKELEIKSRMLSDLEGQLERLRREAEEAREAKRLLEERYRDPVGAAERISRLLERLDDIISLRARLGELEERLEKLKEQAEELERLRADAERYQELTARLKELESIANEYNALKRIVEAQEAEAEQLKRRLEESRSRARSVLASLGVLEGVDLDNPDKIGEKIEWLIERVEEALKRTREKRQELEKRISSLESKVTELGNNIEKISSARGRCPLCGRPLSEEERLRLVKRLRGEKERNELELVKLRSMVYRLQREEREYEERLERLRRLQLRLQRVIEEQRQLLSRLGELEEKLRELRRRLLELQPRYAEYRDALEEAERLEAAWKRYLSLSHVPEQVREVNAAHEETRARLETVMREAASDAESLGLPGDAVAEPESLRAELLNMREEIGRIREKAERLEELEEKLRELEEGVERLRGEVSRARGRMEELERLLAEAEEAEKRLEELREREASVSQELAAARAALEMIKRDEEELKRLEEEAGRLRRLIKRYEEVVGVLRRIREALHPDRGAPRVLRRQTRDVMVYYLKEILERFNFDLVDVALEDDYTVVITTHEGRKTVDMLSGGERVAVAIAFRLALAKAAAGKVESLIMDEPTVHLDEERRGELVNIIRSSLDAAGLTQLIVVTHDREVEEAADHVIEVRKVNGVSEVVEKGGEGLEGGAFEASAGATVA